MTVKIGIVTNPFDPRTWVEEEGDNARDMLKGRYPQGAITVLDLEGFGDWKRAAALIDPAVMNRRDVTPRNKGDADKLAAMPGPFLVMVRPRDPLTAIIAVVALVVGIAAAFLLRPQIPTGARQQSPNNQLSSRQNQPRVNGRIPDIRGTVESTPDLLMVPYNRYVDNLKTEIAYMGVGVGSYAIARVRDGSTSIASISGASAAIYGPNTSPNSGDAPQLQIGAAITDPIKTVLKVNEVNGQTLQPTNLNRIQGEDSIRFVYPDTIQTNDSTIDFDATFDDSDAIEIAQAVIDGSAGSLETTANARFAYVSSSAGKIEFQTFDPSAQWSVGEFVTIINGQWSGSDGAGGVIYVDVTGTYEIGSLDSTSATLVDPAATNDDWDTLNDYPSDRTDYHSVRFSVPTSTTGLNLNGNYTILTVSTSTIILNNPALVNSAWNNIADLPGGATPYISPSISRNTESWVGPFIIDLDENDTVLANFVALNGLYTLSKKKGKQKPMTVGVALEITPVNINDASIGPAETFTATMVGDDEKRTAVGVTLEASPTASGRCSVRARRTTPTPDDDDYGAIVDEVKWEECFGLAPVEAAHFGNVTTVHTKTVATPSATSVKERKLNMRVTRKLPQRISGSTFGPEEATDSADDIIASICLDPYIGRRDPSEVDFDSIYDTIAEVKSYFGAAEAGQFGFTFDDVDISFEETIATVCTAVFCTAFRQGRVIRLTFEKASEDSSLLFNGYNIMPGTQKRTVRFGTLDDHDGVELDYVDPVDGAPLTYKIPDDSTALSPLSVKVDGVRSELLAYWQSWRSYNKSRRQNTALEMETTQEGMLTIPRDLVRVVDKSRQTDLEGEIVEEDGTTLTLTDPAELDGGTEWAIFIQHIDGTTESLGVTTWTPPPGEDPDTNKVTISGAPRLPLAVDEALAMGRAKYIIVPVLDVKTTRFIITEKEPGEGLTVTLRGVNYSFLYYQNDELVLWLPFNLPAFLDSGPYGRDGIASGGATTITDSLRGTVYSDGSTGGQVAFPTFTQPTSYTKAAWIKYAGAGGGGVLTSTHETFGFSGGNFVGGHDGAQVQSAWPGGGEWHHVVMTYDDQADTMALYIDAALVDFQSSAPARTKTQLIAFKDLVGRADELRLWKRALTQDEVHAVYLDTKITP